MGRPKGSKNKPKVVGNTTNTSAVKPTIETPSGKKTVAEVKDVLTKYDYLQEVFASTNSALQLVDLTKEETRTFRTFSKDTLRTYMKSPKSYESQLRNLSRYLFRLCYEFKRICTFSAKMICGDCFDFDQIVNLIETPNPEEIKKLYYGTISYWQNMRFWNELVKLLIVAWREDKVCGYIYDDSEQTGGTFFAHILDNDYCKISSVENGVFRYAFDFSYFRSHEKQLEFWDSEFQKKYNNYLADSTLRWQEIDPERQICFKVNSDDPTMDYPPFAQLFNSIIDAIDLQEIQSVKDELSIYKLLVARLKPLSGTDEPDDFEIDVKTAIKYYNRMAESLPPYVSAVLSPMDIVPVEFKNLNTTDDTDMISSSLSNLFKHIGGVILDNDKTGTTVYEAQIIENVQNCHATLLPQIEEWLNLYLNYKVGDNHATARYITDVSPYTRKAKRKELLESAQNGFATRIKVAILDGQTPLEFLSKLYLEHTVLGLNDLMIPLSTSYTISGSASETDPTNGGRPTSDSSDLTDSGSATREK